MTALQRGAIMVVICMAIMGLIDSFVIVIAQHAGLWQFHFTRALMALPLLVLAGWAFGVRLLPIRYWAVALRSLLFGASMLLYFGAIPMMPISLVVAGIFTSPIFVLVFSVLFFGTEVGRNRILAVAIGFVGVLMVLNPFGATFSPWVLLPVAGGALYALGAIAARRYCAEESTVAMLIGFFATLGIFGAVGLAVLPAGEGATFLSTGWRAASLPFLGLVLMQAVGSIIAVGLLTYAYQTAETSYLVVFEYALMIFASFWGFVLFGQSIGLLAGFGMFLIVLSGVIISLRTPPETEEAPAR